MSTAPMSSGQVFEAIRDGDLTKVQQAIKEGFSIESRFEPDPHKRPLSFRVEGLTMLGCALFMQQKEIAKWLLDRGAKWVTLRQNTWTFTPLDEVAWVRFDESYFGLGFLHHPQMARIDPEDVDPSIWGEHPPKNLAQALERISPKAYRVFLVHQEHHLLSQMSQHESCPSAPTTQKPRL